MRGRYKRKNVESGDDRTDLESGLSPVAGVSVEDLAEPYTPVPGSDDTKKGARSPIHDADKVYLGVRVKMPVRDLLRNIRVAEGREPQECLEVHNKRVKGRGKQVLTRSTRLTKSQRLTATVSLKQRKQQTKSLEELAIIVEVLEEDLKSSNVCRSSPKYQSPEHCPTGSGYNSDRSDEMIPSPQSYMSFSPGSADCTAGFKQPSSMANDELSDPDWSLDSSAFFCAQLQKEESQLWYICDNVLLATDDEGRTALHKVACNGKRALGYAIAKRMAALNSLDLKDSDGMTALLLAAQHNHHLMVSDLIRLGANVNEMNRSGKSCLHLSAEKGYVRVLEVLKHTMMNGVYVDVEANDNSGMSVLQCASVALKATVCELRGSPSRLHSLLQEQMLETLECLLQMASYPHIMGGHGLQPRMG